MAIIDSTRDVKSTGLKNSKAFGISENSTKIFSMLSNLLYKDKERSVLTELSSNAIDAHKLVDKAHEPIHVTLPTMLVPEVKIRDFGPGLSEEDVFKFLTTYGESSKQTTDEFIGGFGIGSKSPASVTDSWTVNSYHAGVHKQYLIHVTSAGVPSLNKIVEKPTTESGLEVVIPVKRDAINAWQVAANKTFMMYPVKPVMHNAPPAVKIENIYTTDSFMFVIGINSYTNGLAAVLINHRIYPIDYSKLKSNDSSSLRTMLKGSGGLLLRFETGELDLSLSREDLQYTNKTIKAIENKFDEAAKDYKDLVEKELKGAVDIFDFAQKAINLYSETLKVGQYHIQNLHQEVASHLPLYNESISLSSRYINFSSSYELTDIKVFDPADGKINKKIRKSSFADYREVHASNGVVYRIGIAFPYIKRVKFVVDDASMTNIRVKQYLSEHECIIAKNNFKFLPKILHDQIVLASSLPKPVITRKPRGEVADSEIFIKSGKHFERVTEQRMSELVKLRDCVYVEFTNANTISSITKEFTPYLYFLENESVSVFGTKPGREIPSKDVLHPKDYLMKKYQEWLPYEENSLLLTFYDSYRTKFEINRMRTAGVSFPLTSHNSVWNRFVKLLQESEELSKKYNIQHMQHYSRKLKEIRTILKLAPPKCIDNVSKLKEEFEKAYPMLNLLVKHSFITLTSEAYIDIIFKYVNETKI